MMSALSASVPTGFRRAVAVVVLAAAPSIGFGQVPTGRALPTADQAQAMLQNDPALVARVRAKLAASGLSPSQIRAKLTAAGYPSTLLDAYMPGADSTSAMAPVDSVLRAAQYLGLVDSLQAASDSARVAASLQLPAPPPTPADTADKGPRIFGLSLFRNATSQFQPDIAGPVDANYRVGPGDVLALILTGDVETSYTLEVTREGFIVIPQVGQVYVANLTLDQINDVLSQRLRRVYSGIGRNGPGATRFYVTVARLRTNQIYVIGEVMAPASYQISSAGTILTALYAAGGPSVNGSLRDVQVRRAGVVVAHLDVYDYLKNGDVSKDTRLQNGDVVFVPVHGSRVQISGEIGRPAIYEMKPDETLNDLIALAGGFTARAARNRILVNRILPPSERPLDGGRDRTIIEVRYEAQRAGSDPPFTLQAGDEITVFAIPDKVRNAISLQGDVWMPGPQGFTPGMKLSDALRQAGGVKPDVKDVMISRLQSDQTRLQLRASVSDTLGHLVNDVSLQEDDSITVFGTSEFRPERYVTISGAVQEKGRFPWHEGMTLRDLVHEARGLSDGAYLVNAEVSRLPDSHSDGQLSSTELVPLDSTYLLDRGLDGQYVGPPGIPTAGKAPDFVLRPYDHVLILKQPGWQLERSVTILGEVRFPGTYALESKTEPVSELIEHAGGLTSRAYAGGTRFTRSAGGLGRIGIDLANVVAHPHSREDIVLIAGDSIYVPQYEPTVKVEGAVNSPMTVAYVPGAKLSYYMRSAGGPNYQADANRAYVRQANGIVDTYRHRAILPDHDPRVLPGAVIVVPTKDPQDRKDWGAIAGSVAQIITGSVAIIAIILRK